MHSQNSQSASQRGMYYALAAGMLTITLFALSPAATRVAVGQISGIDIGIFRTVGGGLLALPILFVLRLRGPQTWADWGLLVVSALGSFIGFPMLFSLGTANTSACHAALIMATMPLLTGAIAMLLERRIPRFAWFAGSVIALAGEILLARSGSGFARDSSLTGDALILLSCFSFACGVVAGARLTARINSWAATFWGLVIASICLIPLALMRGVTVPWTSLSVSTWAALFHVAVGATILAYVAWFWALSRGGIVRIAPIQFAQPVLALLFAAAIAKEHLPAQSIFAAALIIPGVAIACRTGNSSKNETHNLKKITAAAAPQPRRSFKRIIKDWYQARKDKEAVARMSYQEQKDLGFPVVFRNTIMAPGRKTNA